MQEILPGIFHWTALHEKIKTDVHSYFVSGDGAGGSDAQGAGGILIDPMLPAEGLDWFGTPGHAPRAILLTNRHHYRASAVISEATGATVHCHREGLHEFTAGQPVEPFEHGDTLAGGIEAVAVGVLCPEETAFFIPRLEGAIVLGDAVIRWAADGPLSFVPDEYMGDAPDAKKEGLRVSLAQLLDRDFEHLLLAHGDPFVGDGKAALREFLDVQEMSRSDR